MYQAVSKRVKGPEFLCSSIRHFNPLPTRSFLPPASPCLCPYSIPPTHPVGQFPEKLPWQTIACFVLKIGCDFVSDLHTNYMEAHIFTPFTLVIQSIFCLRRRKYRLKYMYIVPVKFCPMRHAKPDI